MPEPLSLDAPHPRSIWLQLLTELLSPVGTVGGVASDGLALTTFEYGEACPPRTVRTR
jgi:hypothetical protein